MKTYTLIITHKKQTPSELVTMEFYHLAYYNVNISQYQLKTLFV